MRAVRTITMALSIAACGAGVRAEEAPPPPVPSPAPEAAATRAPPPEVRAGLPIKLGASVTVRQDWLNLEDKPDLLLPGNNVNGLVSRIRFTVDYKDPMAPTSGGIRLSVGETL